MTQKQEDRVPDEESSSNLDDLYNEAMLAKSMKNAKQARIADPSLKNSLDALAKKMRELYTLPENWERTRGVALIDKATQTLVGNFSEYLHKTVPHTRKLLREHTPISIDAVEMTEGYLGEQMEFRLRGNNWEIEHQVVADVLLDELGVGCPHVKMTAYTKLGATVRVCLQEQVQFASVNGAMLLMLPAGTNIWEAMGTDSKVLVRKGLT